MNFEWCDKKNKINYEKHGLDFKDSNLIFSSKTITFVDDRRDYGEKRFITIGELSGRIVVVAHTQRGKSIRVISMRKANEREKKNYFKRLKEIG